MRTEELGKHRYLSVSEDISKYVGQEVFVRWSTDYGDDTFWERGILVSVQPLPTLSIKSHKGIWRAKVDGSLRAFEWCAIQLQNTAS